MPEEQLPLHIPYRMGNSERLRLSEVWSTKLSVPESEKVETVFSYLQMAGHPIARTKSGFMRFCLLKMARYIVHQEVVRMREQERQNAELGSMQSLKGASLGLTKNKFWSKPSDDEPEEKE